MEKALNILHKNTVETYSVALVLHSKVYLSKGMEG